MLLAAAATTGGSHPAAPDRACRRRPERPVPVAREAPRGTTAGRAGVGRRLRSRWRRRTGRTRPRSPGGCRSRTPPRSPRAPAAPPGRSPPRPSGRCRPGSTPCRPGAQPPAAALAHVSSTSAPLTADCLDPTLGRAASPRSQIRGGTPSRPDRAGSATSPAGAEDVGEVEAYRLLELIVGAAARVTVGTPADELDGVAESGAFHVVV